MTRIEEIKAKHAELRAALEPFRDCQVKVGMNGLVPMYRTVGMVLDSFPRLAGPRRKTHGLCWSCWWTRP